MINNSVNNLQNIWNNTWKWLCDGILYNERRTARNPGTTTKQILYLGFLLP